jgi:hypothetical protein
MARSASPPDPCSAQPRHPVPIRWAVAGAVLAAAAALASPARGQGPGSKCGDAFHYRWAQKTDAGLAPQPPTSVDLPEIVGTWTAPPLPADDWCAARQRNELHVYSVTGWVRVLRHETDLDWHIELTSTSTGPIKQCMIAEIPTTKYSPLFASARKSLTHALQHSTVDSTGPVRPPVRLRFVGAAFFDGWHLTHGRHGDCNHQPGGLWELHPVFRVEQP